MIRKLALALPRARARRSPSAQAPRSQARVAPTADPGVTPTSILLGGDDAADAARPPRTPRSRAAPTRTSSTSTPRGGVQRPQDHVQVRRRRLQPGADRPGDAQARRAGQGVRDLQRARHRAQPRDARLPEREPRCRSCSSPRVRRRSGRDARASTRTRSASSRATRPRDGCYGKYLARTQPAPRRSRCSSRTTTTARICSTGSSAASQRSKVKIVAAQQYEVTAADVQSQVAKLKASARTRSPCSRRRSSRSRRTSSPTGWVGGQIVINNAVSSASNMMRSRARAARTGRRRRRLDRLPQGSGRSAWARTRRTSSTAQIMRRTRGRERRRRLPRVRHGGGVHDGRGDHARPARTSRAPGLRRRPATRWTARQPVPPAGDPRQDRAGRPLPDRADAAAALAEGRLEALRRARGGTGRLRRRGGGSAAPRACDSDCTSKKSRRVRALLVRRGSARMLGIRGAVAKRAKLGDRCRRQTGAPVGAGCRGGPPCGSAQRPRSVPPPAASSEPVPVSPSAGATYQSRRSRIERPRRSDAALRSPGERVRRRAGPPEQDGCSGRKPVADGARPGRSGPPEAAAPRRRVAPVRAPGAERRCRPSREGSCRRTPCRARTASRP